MLVGKKLSKHTFPFMETSPFTIKFLETDILDPTTRFALNEASPTITVFELASDNLRFPVIPVKVPSRVYGSNRVFNSLIETSERSTRVLVTIVSSLPSPGFNIDHLLSPFNFM